MAWGIRIAPARRLTLAFTKGRFFSSSTSLLNGTSSFFFFFFLFLGLLLLVSLDWFLGFGEQRFHWNQLHPAYWTLPEIQRSRYFDDSSRVLFITMKMLIQCLFFRWWMACGLFVQGWWYWRFLATSFWTKSLALAKMLMNLLVLGSRPSTPSSKRYPT